MSLSPTKLSYTVEEAAEAVGICRTSIREMIADQTLKSLKLKGRRLIRREALIALLDAAAREEDTSTTPPSTLAA